MDVPGQSTTVPLGMFEVTVQGGVTGGTVLTAPRYFPSLVHAISTNSRLRIGMMFDGDFNMARIRMEIYMPIDGAELRCTGDAGFQLALNVWDARQAKGKYMRVSVMYRE